MCHGLLALAAFARPSTDASAQTAQQIADTAGSARVTGTVYDSVANEPLAGAQVQFVAAGTLSKQYMAVSDSLGRFEFDALPPGNYIAGFFHPTVDLLGMESPLRAVTVIAGVPNTVRLAIPGSGRTLVSLCGKQNVSDSLGAIVGRVRDADSRGPISGANVVVTWLQVIFNGKLESTPRTETATTDIDGVYRICGLPGADTLFAMAQMGVRQSGKISVHVPAGGVARSDFTIGDSSSAVAVALDSTSGEELRRLSTVLRGSSTLTGIVHGDRASVLPEANVSVSGTGLSTSTDSKGRFLLSGLPAGTFTVEARAIGRAPRAAVVNLVSDSAATVEFTLDKSVQDLSRITVYGTPPKNRPDIDEFLKRKAAGFGHFLTAVDLQHAVSVSSAIRMIPGVRILATGVFSTAVVMHMNRCSATIFVDGIKLNPMFESIDDIPTNQIAGIEVYTDALETPPRFTTLSNCGAVVIWRKY